MDYVICMYVSWVQVSDKDLIQAIVEQHFAVNLLYCRGEFHAI